MSSEDVKIIQDTRYKLIEHRFKSFKARKYAFSKGVPTYLTATGDKLWMAAGWLMLGYVGIKVIRVSHVMMNQPSAETPHPSER